MELVISGRTDLIWYAGIVD